jgi:hypothetical protein
MATTAQIAQRHHEFPEATPGNQTRVRHVPEVLHNV